MSSRKRARPESGSRRVRPIDKQLINVNAITGTTSTAITLQTTTFPCTITGLRWSIGFANKQTTGPVDISWAIVIVRDGNAANALSQTSGSSLYQPEQNVLAYGCTEFQDADLNPGGSGAAQFEGSTKTMRKLMGGDVLQFLHLGSVAASADFMGTIQFFCKT